MDTFVTITLLFLAAEALLTAIQLPLRKKKMRTAVRVVLAVVKLLLSIGAAALVMVGPLFLRPVGPFLMALYLALFADGVADVVFLIANKIRKSEYKFTPKKIFSLVFGAVFFVYGVVNMQIVTPLHHEYESDKISQPHKFIFAADLHVGSSQTFEITKKIVEKMKSENAEFVVLVGDVVDFYTTDEEMLETFELFRDFGAPVFYVWGNHERHDGYGSTPEAEYSEAEIEKAITDCGMIILKDEYLVINNDIVLLGREDMSEKGERADISELKNPAPDSYLILADHQPFDFKTNLAAKPDLQISGHTHAGQLFPLGELFKLFAYSYGEFEKDGANLIVTNGASGWRMPLRTDRWCNYEVVELKPAD